MINPMDMVNWKTSKHVRNMAWPFPVVIFPCASERGGWSVSKNNSLRSSYEKMASRGACRSMSAWTKSSKRIHDKAKG